MKKTDLKPFGIKNQANMIGKTVCQSIQKVIVKNVPTSGPGAFPCPGCCPAKQEKNPNISDRNAGGGSAPGTQIVLFE
jgi:hypothetical protein